MTAAVGLGASVELLRLSHCMRRLLERLLEAASVERGCRHAVQLVNDVLGAAEHAAEAWEAAVSA